ncbi:MAG: SDR family oxidoreductase [Allosphingosinicella sp.]|uniref:SDR family oxidoreductase n=1 Tax=Allosphingosinicella sp. TaxID=2823234 RepID=UPI00395166EF
MTNLTTQKVLILGGSGAMGSAVARLVAAAGGDTIIVGRDEAKLAGAAVGLGSRARALVGDFAIEAEAARIYALAGRVDHVVVALSTGGSRASSIPGTDLAGFKSAHARLWASYNALHLAQRFVAPGGSIVLVSGSSGRRPTHGFGVWTTLHGGIEALARAAAVELAPIRVNVVSPGGIGMRPDRQLAAHAGTPEDVATAILALITNPAVTNAVLDVDGGERLGRWSGGARAA